MSRGLRTLWTKSIRRQLILGIALVHAILMTIFVTDMVLRQREFLNQQSVHNTENLAHTLAASSTSWVLADDVIGLEEVVMSQTDFPDLMYVMILAPDGRVLGHNNAAMVGKYLSDEVSRTLLGNSHEIRHLVSNREMVDIAAPIIANERLVGWARVAVSQQSINDGLRVITRDGIFYTLLAIFVGSIFAVLMASGITRGLHHLVHVAERLRAGDAQARSTLDRPDELGTLGVTLNAMIEAVAEEQERLRVTLYSIADGVITTDTNRRVVLVNPVAEQMMGLKQSDVVGLDLEDVLNITCHGDGCPCESIIRDTLANGDVASPVCDSQLQDKNGRQHTVAQTCSPIRDSFGQVVGAVLVIRDITGEKEMQDHMLKAKSLESVGLLAGGIAHDFNNLLTAIIGNVDLAGNMCAPDGELAEVLGSAQTAAFRARDLTLQLLTFSRGGDPVRGSHLLPEVIEETAGFVLSGANVRCQYDFSEDLHPVLIDKGQISQVVQNLILNAAQAMPHGGTVQVRAKNINRATGNLQILKPGDYVKLEIADTGIGIPADYVNQIFDPYFSTKSKGSGLGLAVTHSIVTKHGGHIEVASEPGVGTTFTIYLPAASSSPAAPVGSTIDTKPGKGTILIIDDEDQVLALVSRILIGAGHDVLLAIDGTEGVAKYFAAMEAGNAVAMVIVDLTIPGGMGGQEAATQLLARDPAAKIVVSSGYSNDPVMANYEQYGFIGVLAKPYTRDDLLQVVHKVLAVKPA